jgi:tetratricopeptide (TPR) repeat protein
MLGELGRFAGAIAFIKRAIELDPLNPMTREAECRSLYRGRNYPKAEAMALRLIATNPKRRPAKIVLASIQILTGRSAAAAASLAALPPGEAHRLTLEAILAALQHDRAASERVLGDLRSRAGDAAYYQYAQIYAQRGEIDEAFIALNAALRLRDTGLPAILVDPFMDPLRKDARYSALIKALNVPT